jgi:dTDP-4-amino-4,6-dideoxygalactose transaminase
MPNKISFFDYSVVNSMLESNILERVRKVMGFSSTSQHKDLIREFERSFADYCNTTGCLALNSGTSALQLALLSQGVRSGDEVIVPAYTFAASAIVVSNIGAKPVFVDVKESDLTIDEKQIEERLNEKTKAVIAVHIHGNPCQLGTLTDICERKGLALIEDASQAHGATYDGRKVGSYGLGCFSLHMSKNLGALGRAGAVTYSDPSLRDVMLRYLNPDNNTVEVLQSGRTPCDMDAVQACFLIPKLKILDNLNARKSEMAKAYERGIDNAFFVKPIINENGTSVFRDYFVFCDDRLHAMQILADKGIESKARYKIPLHLTETYAHLGYKEGDFPVAEKAAKSLLCLPTHLGIKDQDIEYICSVMNGINGADK